MANVSKGILPLALLGGGALAIYTLSKREPPLGEEPPAPTPDASGTQVQFSVGRGILSVTPDEVQGG